MNNKFEPENYFDLSEFTYRDLFDGVDHVWEVLPKISKYIQEMFDSGKLRPNYKDSTNIYIGENTVIEDHVHIKGPAIVGNNCFIAHAAYLRENCLLGNGVHIGHASEIKNSVFLNDSKCSHLNHISDSIIGNKVRIAGGANIANLRLDRKSVLVKSGEEKIDTKLIKFGAVVGDNTFVGANVVLNPGTILGKEAKIHPLVSVKGVHKNGEVIK